MVGLPNFLSRTTFRPFGPRVTLTAWAMTLTPRRSDARASSLNRSCLAMNGSFQVVQPIDGGRGNHLGAENAEDVLFLHDQVLLAVQGDLASGVLAEQHAIACLDVQGGLLAVLADRAFADGEDLALLRLFLGAVRDDEAAAANLLFLDPLDQDAVVERMQGGLQGLGHGADTSSFGCVRRSRRVWRDLTVIDAREGRRRSRLGAGLLGSGRFPLTLYRIYIIV